MVGLLLVEVARGGLPACRGEADRALVAHEVPLGAQAEGGRLTTVAAVDIDQDGRDELVGAVVPLFGEASPMGWWSASTDPAAPPVLRSEIRLSFAGLRMLTGDVDGDGDVDVVIADPGTDEVFRMVWLPDGIAMSPRYRLADLGPEPLVADLGGDGAAELLSVSPLTIAAAWSLAADPQRLVEGAVDDGVAQAVGDLDGDGAPDWLIAQGARSRITVAWGGDLGRQESIRVPLRDVRGMVPADVDADGTMEVLAVDRRRAAIRRLDGPRLRKGPWIVRLADRSARDTPLTARVADVDGDGCPDVLLHSFATQELAIAWAGARGHVHVQRLRTGAGPLVVAQLDEVRGDDVAVVDGDRVLVLSMPAHTTGSSGEAAPLDAP